MEGLLKRKGTRGAGTKPVIGLAQSSRRNLLVCVALYSTQVIYLEIKTIILRISFKEDT